MTVGHATRCDLGAAKSDRIPQIPCPTQIHVGWAVNQTDSPSQRVREAVPYWQCQTLRERNIALLDTAHQRINHSRCRVGSEPDRFTNLAIALLGTAHQRINHN
ncbi:hypothetical protein [Moorena producens]|uniref:hypothetical protein n=1 Tax=Moorena producens TaxID=1155739 RepID=UPI003C777EFB